ncbi:MAG: DNA modification system-associated small protein [Pseudomonadales bacterium]
MDENYIEDGYLDDLPMWSDENAQAVLHSVCERHRVPVEVISELVALQRERQHQERAHGINLRFEEILGVIEE